MTHCISIEIPTGSFDNRRYRNVISTYTHPITNSDRDLINVVVSQENLKNTRMQLGRDYGIRPGDVTIFPSSNRYTIEFRLPRGVWSDNRYHITDDMIEMSNSAPTQTIKFTTNTTDLNALIKKIQLDYGSDIVVKISP